MLTACAQPQAELHLQSKVLTVKTSGQLHDAGGHDGVLLQAG